MLPMIPVAGALSAALLLGVGTDPLRPVVEEALRANLSLRAERTVERQAASRVTEAAGLYLPRVDVESRVSEFDGVQNLGDLVNPAFAALNSLTGAGSFPTNIDLTFPQAHDTHLRVMQPILAEGIRANLSATRAQHDAARDELAAAARDIAAAAQIAYLEQASASRVVEVHESARALAAENQRVAERLLAAGSATPEAVLRARADLADVEQQLAEARQQHAAAQRAFNRVLGRPLDAPVVVIPDEAFDRPLPVDEEQAVASALAHREELAAAGAGIRAARAAKHATTARYLPTVSFAFDYGFTGPDVSLDPDEDYWTASLVAQWELLSLTREGARSAAGHEMRRAEIAREDAEGAILLQVRTAYEAAVTARDAVATADTRLEASRRTFELVRRRYEEGAASPLELTDARTGLTSAELNRVLTAYRSFIRQVELERAAALRDVAF